MTLFKTEMKMNRKSFLIWTICIAATCFGCILMYTSMEESVAQMANMFANLGGLSKAFGMDKISIGTLEGYFAIEVALMHNLGGVMFAAILGASLLSKEEGGHTAEFLNTLPITRRSIVGIKYMVMLLYILAFNFISVGIYLLGFVFMGESFEWTNLLLFLLTAIVMQLEIGGICFMISAYQKRSQPGFGIGMIILFYAMDMMCRLIPKIQNLKYITPFYYANVTDIFSNGKLAVSSFMVGIFILIIAPIIGGIHYNRKDLS